MDIMSFRRKAAAALGITSLVVLSSDVLRWGPRYVLLRYTPSELHDREQHVRDIYEAIRLGTLENATCAPGLALRAEALLLAA
jgi:hypothetical protein